MNETIDMLIVHAKRKKITPILPFLLRERDCREEKCKKTKRDILIKLVELTLRRNPHIHLYIYDYKIY